MKDKGTLRRISAISGVLLVMALTASPAIAASDETLTIKNMKVSIWPEYDDPRVMVTYQGEFKDASVFPKPVKFPAPQGSEINMVCALQPPDETHLCQLYDTLTETGTLAISYNLPIPTYYLEYYWDGIKSQTDKSFSFDYVSPYAVDNLEIEVQQPLKATNFKLDQPYVSASSDALGMKYYRYVFSNVAAGQAINIKATYTKPDNKPSVAKKTSAGTVTTSSNSLGTNFLITGGVIIITVIAGFVLFRRKPAVAHARTQISRKAARLEARQISAQYVEPVVRRQRQPEPKPVRPAQAKTTTIAPAKINADALFCSKCGTKLAQEAAFCHVCGAKAVGYE